MYVCMYVYIYICMYMCVYVCMCVRMYVDVVDIDGTFMHMCTRVRRYMGFTYAFLFGECVCVFATIVCCFLLL